MLYVLLCEDKADSEALRMATRDAHLAYVSNHAGRLKLAGPLLTDDAEHMTGSLFIIEADDPGEVRAFHDADPYTRAGLWQRVTLRPFRQVLPRP